ncbi:putative amidohydrolase [Caldalkalibacillus uzonensis]|uniref:Amidohydrolase n=1 Tax=Caldalkalibacillus uzonensis TaxID=353224 RepID=A0ABU0CUJ0_9BACI|nr:nitrilase-related carbon-nitrogen hydrolase [Caldalkalibacillus uzonensis]MDQ0340086.1 putative amidohydrolase [Caldalkalibacillus uzonensis]
MATVAAIQMAPHVGQVERNRKKADNMVREAHARGAQLIVLPELWVTGYDLEPALFRRYAEPVSGPTVQQFQALARELQTVLIVPFPEQDARDGNRLYISAAVINNDGAVLGVQRKSLLWGQEKEAFSAGPLDYQVFETALGLVGVLICYDLEFPEPARLLALKGAQLIICPSVWSKTAEPRWEIQTRARALDNLCYVLGVNAAGSRACGRSRLVNPWGQVITESGSDREEIILAPFDPSLVKGARQHIPYFSDYPSAFIPGGQLK